jgi:hypothetical protein
MVQLKKSTIPRRRRLRQSGGGGSGKTKPVTPVEWAVLLTCIVICSYLLSFFFASDGGGTSGGGGGYSDGSTPQVRKVHGHAVAHGVGRRVPELSDKYNALANDVLSVLDCSQPIPDRGGYEDAGGGGGGGQWDDYLPADRDIAKDYDNGDFHKYDNDFGDDGGGGGPEGERAAAAANLDDDGRVPDIINRNNNVRRRLQIIDDDGNMDAADEKNGNSGNVVRDGGGYNPDVDDFAQGNNSGDWGKGEGEDWNKDYNNDYNPGMDYGVRPKVNGRHLLCLAAGAENLPEEAKKPDAFKCDVLGSKRETLLDLWESARGQQIPADIIVKSLDHAYEHKQKLLDHEVHLWSPWDDEGLKYTINEINVGKEWNRGGLRGLESALGPHKLFVDVGSNLGLTAMAVSLTYPGTAVVAIEPAAPSWLMQELNLRCNSLHPQPHISSVLGGVGPKNNGM